MQCLIDKNGKAVSLTDRNLYPHLGYALVDKPDGMTAEKMLEWRYTDGQWEKLDAQPVDTTPIPESPDANWPTLVITAINADEAHADTTKIAPDFSRVVCPADTVLALEAELRDAEGNVIDFTSTFATPANSRDGREVLFATSLINGVASVQIPLRQSGTWQMNQDVINAGLVAQGMGDYQMHLPKTTFLVTQV